MSNVINQSAFLRTSREFPEELSQLTVETNKMYLDVSQAVNVRDIALYPTTRPAQTGQQWFLSANQQQQGLRQVYTFTAAGNIPHGIPNLQPDQVTALFGSVVSGTSAYGVIFSSNTAIAGQICAHVTGPNIVIAAGGGAPVFTSGRVVLEWISRP